ncbi:PHB depolymerase family esterase, partial [Mesorhizobium sp.]
ETMVLAHGLDRGRIFITGLSAGGAMTSAMLACYPEIFEGGAIIASLPYGSAKTVPEAFDRMRGHGMPSERQLQKAL